MAQRTVRAFMVPHVTPALDIESTFDRTPERCASVHGVGSSVFLPAHSLQVTSISALRSPGAGGSEGLSRVDVLRNLQ